MIIFLPVICVSFIVVGIITFIAGICICFKSSEFDENKKKNEEEKDVDMEGAIKYLKIVNK